MAKRLILNMATAAILDFVKFEFYWKNRLRDPVFCLCEMLRKSVEKWLSCGCLMDFKMAAAAILDF